MTAPPDIDTSSSFAALGLAPPLLDALAALGYEEPTPIQREAIPPLLEGRDLLGQAATGTGKTASFALPLLQRTHDGASRPGGPSALVLVPTRELAIQVAEAVHRYGRGYGVRVLPVYGGQAIGQQLRVLSRGVDVVVATPGRALDHIRRGSLDLATVRVVVLDEADEMLDMGFAEDLEAILDATPAERQTALFSATLPPRIAHLAQRYLRDPVQVRIAREQPAEGETPRVRHMAFIVQRAHKVAALGRILDVERPTSALVFCRTRTEVDELTETLNGRGYDAEPLHGGMSQEQRDRVMRRLRSGAAELLVATDVAARGIDVEHLSHVINYDVPSSPDVYVHRVGRTGRAGREGVAITLAEPREHRQLRNIERLVRRRIEVGTVPTVADLRARRLELTRAALREVLEGDDLDRYRVVVEGLAGEFDVMDVAAAAVKLAEQATEGEEDEQEIPTARIGGRDREAGAREGWSGESRGAEEGTDVASRGEHRGASTRGARARRRGERRVPWEVARLFVGAGRKAGVRARDLVGAIANEVGIDAGAIGAIQIADRFSLVEVPEEIIEDIIAALRASTIKGKRVIVRRDRDE
ncbi:MAG TPA: DEAD/DEAH box helicase [Gemmatimonadaceae bacterium]